MNLARKTVVMALDFAEQMAMVADVRTVARASPLVRPKTPNGLDMRVTVTAAGKLGWVGDGAYRYSQTDSQGKPWPAMPSTWIELADRAARAAGHEPPAWDCAIINWYRHDASLGWHRDKSELDQSLPIVTFSLGDACSWAVRIEDDDPPQRTRLESGDVTVLAGVTRGALHKVERIIETPLFSPLNTRGRLSVTMRQAGAS